MPIPSTALLLLHACLQLTRMTSAGLAWRSGRVCFASFRIERWRAGRSRSGKKAETRVSRSNLKYHLGMLVCMDYEQQGKSARTPISDLLISADVPNSFLKYPTPDACFSGIIPGSFEVRLEQSKKIGRRSTDSRPSAVGGSTEHYCVVPGDLTVPKSDCLACRW
ncbi:hypothetical protein BJ166DRAFT_498974 [Pestalotiopsis sp. NC0098]|nr:hypothetical protein BJ166DRAFT_498974 [Pestalotiopsis sp. NC0098]